MQTVSLVNSATDTAVIRDLTMHSAVTAAMLLVSAALYADDTARALLADSRAKWQALHIADYSFSLSMEGAWQNRTAIRIVVRNGKVQSAHYMLFDRPSPSAARRRGGGPPAQSTVPFATYPWESRDFLEFREGPMAAPAWWLTIPALFKRAEEDLSRPGVETLFKFDPKFGFPTEIASREPHMADSYSVLWVDGFTVL